MNEYTKLRMSVTTHPSMLHIESNEEIILLKKVLVIGC